MFVVEWQVKGEDSTRQREFIDHEAAKEYCEGLHRASRIYAFQFAKIPGIYQEKMRRNGKQRKKRV